MFWRKGLIFVVLAALASSCGVTRRIPEGQYLLRRNIIEVDRSVSRKERVTASELSRYVQQSPNRRFLGTNFYAWLYAQADPEKENGWNRFLRRTGDPVAIWDADETARSVDFLQTYVRSRGFFSGVVTASVDTLRGRKVKVYYAVNQGVASRIGNISYVFRDSLLAPQIMADTTATLLHRGDIFDVETLDAERARVVKNLRDRGYFDFNVSHIAYVADSTRKAQLVDIEMVIRRKLKDYFADGTPEYENHKVYRLGEITVETSAPPTDTIAREGLNIVFRDRQNVRPKVLRRAIELHTDSLYSGSTAAETSRKLMRLGTFRTANTFFQPADNQQDSIQKLNAYIKLTPALRQSFGIEMEGSTTSSFYGLRTTLSYQNRNAFRGAELFEGSLTAGFEFLKSSERKLSYELGAEVSLTFPHPSTVSLSANWQDRVYYSRALFGLSWGTTWSIGRWQNLTLRPLDINLIRMGHIDPTFSQQLNNPYLVASYADQLVAGLSGSYVFNNQPRNLDAGAVVARINFETTGNLLSAFTDKIFGIRFSQYVRGEGSFSHKIMLAPRTAIAYRVQAGAIYSYGNSTSPPFEKLFFAGGVNSMRGWAVRTLGPGTALYERQNYPAQMGDVKLEANLELRFPMAGTVNGALFFDVGNIWFMRSKPDEYPDEAVFRLRNFHRQLGFNTGFGVRVDLRLVVLRLDWGVQLHNPGRPFGERWIDHFQWKDTALNFGVGYPF